ncbi:MAG: hypothetical protein BMS9Abin29_1910 [Gemmatimonadota bacterium]|nr:MAG: hypothetical protein BMS9Abin29_1910 [Gemmatimonadota bacterium]
MKSHGVGWYLSGAYKGFRPRFPGGLPAGWVILMVVLAFTPVGTQAQTNRPWRRDGTISIRTTYDSNVFRLTDRQKNKIGLGGDQFADMEGASDVTVQVAVGGELRRGPSSRRLRIGGGATLDAYTTNTRRTHVTLDAYIARAVTKRDEIKVKFEVTPSEFRRNYLAGGDALGGRTFEEGVSTSFAGQVMYARRLIGGSGPDLDVKVGILGTTRSVDALSWRDRSMVGGRIEFDLKLNSDVNMKFGVSRSRASYTAASQPVIELGTVRMLTADKDFNETKIGGEIRFDLNRDARLALEYGRRTRTYLGKLGTDPAFGGREDARNAFGAELRYEVSKRIDLWIGGKYLKQVTFRPASGSTGDETDYNRSLATLQLVYHR